MTPSPPHHKNSGGRGQLKTLRPRDTRHAKMKSANYTRIVGVLRWALPALIILALSILMLWPRWGENVVALTVVDKIPNLMVEKLNLSGLDAKNQRYTLTADRALQAANARNLIDLQNPKGEIATKGGGWLVGQAAEGRLDQTSKTLWLGGNVELFHDRGFRFSSNEMNVDMDKSAAWGSQPVVIQGDFGEIQGSGFHLSEAGKVMVITGHATAKLHLQGAKGSGKPKTK